MNNVYDRMINMLLEARAEVLIEAKKLEELRHKGTDPKTGARTTSPGAADRFARNLEEKPGAQTAKVFDKKVTTSGDKPGNHAASVKNAQDKVTSVKPRGGKLAIVRGR